MRRGRWPLSAVPILCSGPPGSKATATFGVDQLGPFGLPPTTCSGVTWQTTTQSVVRRPVWRTRARRARWATRITAPPRHRTRSRPPPAGPSARSHRACLRGVHGLLRPADQPVRDLVHRRPDDRDRHDRTGFGRGGGSSGGGGSGGGGGGGSCGASVQRAPAALRRPFTGVIGGGGGSPSPSPVPTATPTTAPSPSPSPSASPAPCAPSPSPSADWTEDPVDQQEQIEPSSVRRPSQVLESCIGKLIVENPDDKPVRYRHTVTCNDPSAVVKHVELEFLSWLPNAKDATPQYDKVEADCPPRGRIANCPPSRSICRWAIRSGSRFAPDTTASCTTAARQPTRSPTSGAATSSW